MKTPIVLYLDTQDFSRISDCLSGRGADEIKPVLDRLLHEIDSGRVVVPLSMAHLSELIQYEGGGRDLALRKATALERICGRWAFRYFGDILDEDFHAFAATKIRGVRPPRLPPNFPVDTNLRWYSSTTSDVEIDHFEKGVSREFKELGTLNRAQRRQGQQRVRASRRTLKVDDNWLRSQFKNRPMTEDFYAGDFFGRFMRGEINQLDMTDAAMTSICTPTKFVIWYFEYYRGEHAIPKWMRGIGDEVLSIILEYQNKLRDIGPLPYDLLKPSIEKIAIEGQYRLAKKFFESSRPELKRRGISDTNLDRIATHPELINARSAGTLARTFGAYFIDHARIGPNDRKPHKNDGGDMAHMFYLPFCDIWRGEPYFANLGRRVFPNSNVEIAGRLLELPQALDRAISHKEA